MTTEREKIIQLARECGITHNTWDEHDNQGTIAFYHAAQAEAFEAAANLCDTLHECRNIWDDLPVSFECSSAIREMAKEKQNAD